MFNHSALCREVKAVQLLNPQGPHALKTAIYMTHTRQVHIHSPKLHHAAPSPAIHNMQPELILSSSHCTILPHPLRQGQEAAARGGRRNLESVCYCSWSKGGVGDRVVAG